MEDSALQERQSARSGRHVSVAEFLLGTVVAFRPALRGEENRDAGRVEILFGEIDFGDLSRQILRRSRQCRLHATNLGGAHFAGLGARVFSFSTCQ